MFYGLNNFIKKILPKRLFYRSLIIVATPIILLQIIITVVFFDSLWIKANKGMTRSLVSEVKTLVDAYKINKEDKIIIDLYNKNFDFVVTIKKNEYLPDLKTERWFSPMDRSLRRELKSSFGSSYWFDTTAFKELVDSFSARIFVNEYIELLSANRDVELNIVIKIKKSIFTLII